MCPQLRTMVDTSNVDEQLRVLNHFDLDLLVPFALEQRAQRCSFFELQHELRRYWLAYLQESNCPNVMHSILRQIFGYFARSARRNGLAMHNASPSLRGIFGKCVALDELQEWYVLLVKKFMLAPGSKQLQNVLNTVASNLDIPLQWIPHLEHKWSRKLLHCKRSSGEGGLRVQVTTVARLMWRCFSSVDQYRLARSGEQGELGRMMRAQRLQLDKPVSALLKAKAFYFLDEGGGPLRLVDTARLAAFPELASDAASAKARFGAELIGLSFGQLGADGSPVCSGELRASKKGNDEALGYVRSPWGAPSVLRLAAAVANSITPNLLTGMRLEALTSDQPDEEVKLVRISWSTTDVALGWIRSILPHDALILRLFDGPPPSTDCVDVLVDALKAGECVIARSYSLQEAAQRAHSKAPRVHISGISAARTPSGRLRRTAARLRTPKEERVHIWRFTTPPAVARGETQPVKLFLYHPANPAATPDAAGGRKVKVSKESGVAQQHNWSLAQASEAAAAAGGDREAAARLTAAKARSKQFTNLYEATRSVFLDGDAHSSTAGVVAMPKPRGRPNILDKGLATPGQWGVYRSPLPSRLGSKQADLCGGDNLQLKAVKSWLKAMAKQHCEERVVFTMLYELHCKGAAFDWSKLVKRSGGGRSARGGGGGGGGDGGGDGGGGGGGSLSDEEAKAKLSKEIEAEEKVFALLKARVIGLQQNTSGGATDHELLTGLLPELLAELTASHQKLAALRQRALDGIFSAVASPARTPTASAAGAADEDDVGDDFDNLPQAPAVSPSSSLGLVLAAEDESDEESDVDPLYSDVGGDGSDLDSDTEAALVAELEEE